MKCNLHSIIALHNPPKSKTSDLLLACPTSDTILKPFPGCTSLKNQLSPNPHLEICFLRNNSNANSINSSVEKEK